MSFTSFSSITPRANRFRLLCTLLVSLALAACGRSTLDGLSGSGGGQGGSAGHGGNGGNGNGGHGGTPQTGCKTDNDCNDPTPHCRLDDGVCVQCTSSPQCPNNEVCENFKCVGFCGPGGTCENGLTCCSPLCIDEKTDPDNCGACGKACGPFAHATPSCEGASCGLSACDKGFGNCNGVVSDGCEVNTDSDKGNCGSCGHRCGADESCSGGKCVGACGPNGTCPGGQTCCAGRCQNTQDDPTHCGSCQHDCGTAPHASVTCESGKCAIGGCAAGFGNCDGLEPDGCEVNFSNDPKHCGSCTHACQPGETCSGGTCVGGCGMGQTCQPGFTCCDGTNCADTTNDLKNCGMCDHACGPIAHGEADCAGGACRIGSCDMGFSDCNMKFDDGCEVNTQNDPDNCGTCGHSCGMGGQCRNGACVSSCNGGPPCMSNESCCGNGCTNTQNDPDNCGMCNNECPSGDTCVASMCKPGNTCNGGPACTGGKTCCTSGCSDTDSDPDNCGMCGFACQIGQTCSNGTCQTPCAGGPSCSGSQTCCMTGCADTTSDPNNCGGCGNVCPPTQSCVNSGCANNEGAFDPIVNPTFLPAGVHNYTTINVPAGVTVFVTGGGAASGTLDLRATGAITIDGTIDLSGGPGLQAVITSQSTQRGRAGAGGFTGEPYQSAALSAACAFIAGNSGQLGFDQALGTTGNCAVGSTTVCINQGDPMALIFAAPLARFGGGGGTFAGFRSYGAAGGGPAGGGAGKLGATFPGEDDCSGVAGADGATAGAGGFSGLYRGRAGSLGQTQCPGIQGNIPAAFVGGGGGGSIGAAAAGDLAVLTTFRTGSGGGGGSSDYLNRPAFGGTSGGGGGGGALKLSSPTSIVVHGQLLANGGDGGDANIGTGMNAGCDPQPGAAGGGGSGGLIYLAAPVVTTSGTISAVGGTGGVASEFATGGAGGRGGPGRIRISATQGTCSLGGGFNPNLVSGCNVTPGAGTQGSAYVGAYPN